MKSLPTLALQLVSVAVFFALPTSSALAQKKPRNPDAKNRPSGIPTPAKDANLQRYGIYAKTAPRPAKAQPVNTSLPLQLESGDRIVLIGNSLLEGNADFGHLEAMIQQAHPAHHVTVRHLAWQADEVGVQPRPANFADTLQHLTHEQADVILVAYGFNESFAGEQGVAAFQQQLDSYVNTLRSSVFNGESAPRVILLSPIANENIYSIDAADRNNGNINAYATAIQQVAQDQKVGFVDLFAPTAKAFQSMGEDLTINGIHLNEQGDKLVSSEIFRQLFGQEPQPINDDLRAVIVDKNRQFFRRFRPLNTFYYTGGRNKSYGYLDFLPAMRNFQWMAANRDQRIWNLAAGKPVSGPVDDSQMPAMPATKQSRGANQWMTAADELKAFQVDPRFEVNLFAGEEQFPDIANPIQMRWDSRGRLWVSCSTTYPHVYPGKEPNDKLVILEDTDGDGKADKSTVFADDLHVPLSFEFGNGGVYVSEQPALTFLKDTDGDDKADVHRTVLTGFGTEDSHHSLHDIMWTPDGDMIFRESIFHHTQVETPYGPVRQQNSGWFRYQPRDHRLVGFGSYHSTNPWGVTFDDWGQHMASHPVYAEAFHAIDPGHPNQHPKPTGLQAYSGVCGHQFIDTATFPQDLQGHFVKVRYKPTNRVELLKWKQTEFGYQEEYISDLRFSTNLSFIPVDLQWGPRGALYVCDWYNPIKGHAQYSLRDPRRDRDSGRIWRIVAKDHSLQEPPKIAEASIEQLLDLLKRPETRIRYWAKQELKERHAEAVLAALDQWVANLDASDPRFRHHQLEAVWTYRSIGLIGMPDSINPDATLNRAPPQTAANTRLSEQEANSKEVAIKTLQALLTCDHANARAAATKQLRYFHPHLSNRYAALKNAAQDKHAIVRMQAVIAATYIGTEAALEAILPVFRFPADGHLQYAITCALGSRTLRRHWEHDDHWGIAARLKQSAKSRQIKEPTPSASQAQFDNQKDLALSKIFCIPEKMLFSKDSLTVKPGQPVKIVFTNPDATDHNLVIVKPGALAEVGMAANEMAKDPRNAKGDFVPREKSDLILHASPMIGPTRSSLIHVMRFNAPTEPGIYPYVCTFPGHWVVMNGNLIVAKDQQQARSLLATTKPAIVKKWTMEDFKDLKSISHQNDPMAKTRGMMALAKANCIQCHQLAGHGANLGPDLAKSTQKLKGADLLQQIIAPSSQIHPEYQSYRFLMDSGRIIQGVIVEETDKAFKIAENLLTPNSFTNVPKDQIEFQSKSTTSPMPNGLLDILTKEEILDLLVYLEAGGYELPDHLKGRHGHGSK